METDKIQFKNITKTYMLEDKKIDVFDKLTFTIDPGEVTVLIGKSGCGKTTLLRLIAGLEEADLGELIIPKDIRIGMVFQEDRLMPWLNCEKNVNLGIKKPDRRLTEEIFKMIGLTGYERAYPSQLSGGMRQRVALARTLIRRSNLLLMDEPFSALDAITRQEMQRELINIRKSTNTGIVFVTHDINEALLIGDRIVAFTENGLCEYDDKTVL